MKGSSNFFLFLIFVLSAVCVHSQEIDSLMDAYNTKVPQEKVYIHFDNSLYAPGQTVWYKAYLTTTGDPANISRNFYVDCFDENGKLLQEITAPIINASASGSFTIPKTYNGQQIQLLAYTKWMLNFDSSFLYHHTIAVAQTAMPSAGKNAAMPVTTLRFFPEGGDLVEGIQSTIAFKAMASGLPATIKGVVKNRKGEVVSDFATVHNGMGKMILIPAHEEEYTAEWKDGKGEIQYTKLPSPRAGGITLSLQGANDKWKFTVSRAADSESPKRVMIVASTSQQVAFRGDLNLSTKTTVTSLLPVDKFPSGVLRITVMNMKMQPLAERIIFVNNNEYRVPAKLNADTLNTNKRAKNVFEVEMPDTVGASLSLSITDQAYTLADNIISGLLLSPEIKGSIYEPAFYFSSAEDSIASLLDLVMMTNGWRRFAWENVLSGKTPSLQYGRDTGFLSISGKISKLSDNKIKKAEQVNIIMIAKDSSKQFLFTPLLPDGSFRENNMILFDTVKVYYQLNGSSIPFKSKVAIESTLLPYDTTKRIQGVGHFLSDTTGTAQVLKKIKDQRTLDSLNRLTTLQEVIVKSKAKSPMQLLDDRYTTGWFKAKTIKQLDLLNDPFAKTSPSLYAYLASKVAGLEISDPYSLEPKIKYRGVQVAIFQNELPVTEYEIVSMLPMDIAYIKVFPAPFFGGGAYVDSKTPVLAIYMKHYEDAVMDMKGMDHILLPGYTPVKEFYVAAPAENKPNSLDARRTLYWNPNIITDAETRKVKISFYNNDVSNTMQLVLEGITDDGRLVHYSKTIK